MANDYGYEPWARANLRDGLGLTPQMGGELLTNLDKARERITELEAENTAIRNRLRLADDAFDDQREETMQLRRKVDSLEREREATMAAELRRLADTFDAGTEDYIANGASDLLRAQAVEAHSIALRLHARAAELEAGAR